MDDGCILFMVVCAFAGLVRVGVKIVYMKAAHVAPLVLQLEFRTVYHLLFARFIYLSLAVSK